MKKNGTVSLIHTKTNRPPIRARLVRRQRLFTHLDSGLEKPLSLICAGAGFGKTTLVSTWLEAVVTRNSGDAAPLVAWVSLDEQDSDLYLFLRYFVMAIHKVAPDTCPEMTELLKQRTKSSDAQLLTTLTNDLAAISQKLIVVLDDYHLIRETAVSDFLNGLLSHWPEPLHLILITRHTPPLPLAKLRANDTIVEIRNHDLRFNLEEIGEYVNQTWPLPLAPSNLELLEEKTEGWIAGLQLASLSLRGREGAEAILESLSGTNADIADYLIDEVLSRQPKAFYTFQLKTSVLRQFCPSLCDALTAGDDPDWDARAIIDWLEHGNLFIIPLDNHREWYRYHSLFRNLLHERLSARLNQDEVADLHRRAAHWFAQRGYLNQAIAHALDAQDPDLAASFMNHFLPVILNQEDRATLDNWLIALPQSFVASRPEALMLKAWSLHFSWRIKAVAKILAQVEALLGHADDLDSQDVLWGQIAALKAQQAFFEGQPDRCVVYGREALTRLPESWTFVRSGVWMYLAVSMQAVGEGTAVEKMILEAYESLPDKTSSYALRLLLALCFKYLQTGELKQADQTARLILSQVTDQAGLMVLRGWANLTLGLVHYYRNDLEAARLCFSDLLDKQKSAHLLSARHGLIGLAYVYQASGRRDEAWEVMDILGQFDLDRTGHLSEPTLSAQASLFLGEGDLAEAEQWALEYSAPIQANPLEFLELPHLTKAQILLAGNNEDNTAQALQLLEQLLALAEKNHNARRKIEILALMAYALDTSGKTQAALEVLEQAIRLAQAGRFVRIFLTLGSRMQRLLHELGQHNGAANSVQQILLAFEAEEANKRIADQANNGSEPLFSVSSAANTANLIEPLTRRELQVLTMLREPLGIKEIALKLNMSHGTAKRHTINLYGKLGVSSRWDAVSKAEALGILAPR